MRVARVLDGFVVFWTLAFWLGTPTGLVEVVDKRAALFDRTSGMLMNHHVSVWSLVCKQEKNDAREWGTAFVARYIAGGGWVVLRY